jgi:hypothetical protein
MQQLVDQATTSLNINSENSTMAWLASTLSTDQDVTTLLIAQADIQTNATSQKERVMGDCIITNGAGESAYS